MCVGGVVVVGRRLIVDSLSFVLPTIWTFSTKNDALPCWSGWSEDGGTLGRRWIEGLLSHSGGQQATATDGKSAWKVPD